MGTTTPADGSLISAGHVALIWTLNELDHKPRFSEYFHLPEPYAGRVAHLSALDDPSLYLHMATGDIPDDVQVKLFLIVGEQEISLEVTRDTTRLAAIAFMDKEHLERIISETDSKMIVFKAQLSTRFDRTGGNCDTRMVKLSIGDGDGKREQGDVTLESVQTPISTTDENHLIVSKMAKKKKQKGRLFNWFTKGSKT